MASLPNEKPDEDLRHIIQYAQLAHTLLCDRRNTAGQHRITLSVTDENSLLDFLTGIEERAQAVREKLMGGKLYPTLEQLAAGTPGAESPPMEYLAGHIQPGVSKLLRYYDCVKCMKPHWEDDRAEYDAHVICASKQGVRFGHRTQLGLVR